MHGQAHDGAESAGPKDVPNLTTQEHHGLVKHLGTPMWRRKGFDAQRPRLLCGDAVAARCCWEAEGAPFDCFRPIFLGDLVVVEGNVEAQPELALVGAPV